MAQEENRQVQRVRIAIISLVVAVVVGVIAVGVIGSREPEPEGGYAEGVHYQRVNVSDWADPPGKISVVEFFSYGCIHCKNFDPIIDNWLEDTPEDIAFERMPVSFSPQWRALATAYYAAQELDIHDQIHSRLFAAIHDNGRPLFSPDALAEFADGRGTSSTDFKRMMASPRVSRALERAERVARDAGVSGVPTLMVGGRYKILAPPGSSRLTQLQIAEHLAEKIRSGET